MVFILGWQESLALNTCFCVNILEDSCLPQEIQWLDFLKREDTLENWFECEVPEIKDEEPGVGKWFQEEMYTWKRASLSSSYACKRFCCWGVNPFYGCQEILCLFQVSITSCRSYNDEMPVSTLWMNIYLTLHHHKDDDDRFSSSSTFFFNSRLFFLLFILSLEKEIDKIDGRKRKDWVILQYFMQQEEKESFSSHLFKRETREITRMSWV